VVILQDSQLEVILALMMILRFNFFENSLVYSHDESNDCLSS
jgi:hypothetical protein